MKSTYEIDISAEFGLSEILVEFTKYRISIEKYVAVGPGGGNPNFVVSADPADFASWSFANYSDEPESYRIS